MPCPCNFKKNNTPIIISNQTRIGKEPKKLRTRSEALYTKAKIKTLKKQVAMKEDNIIFKVLPKTTTFKVEKVGNENKINLDNELYNKNVIFTLKKGIYRINDVPIEHAFKLKTDDPDKIKILSQHSKNIDNSNCYYNNVIIMVLDDFGTNGIICCSHGAMGREELFMYKY